MALSAFNASFGTLTPTFPVAFDEQRFIPQNGFGQRFSNYQTIQQVAKGHFRRVEKNLHIEIPKIKQVASELINGKNTKLLEFVRRETSLSNTFFQRLFKAKTPLGEVLFEFEKSQESPHRKLLSSEEFLKAEAEAATLLKKMQQFSTKKLLKQESSTSTGTTPQKVGSQFQVNTETIGTQLHPLVATMGKDDLTVVWKRNFGESYSAHGQRIHGDGSKIGPEFSLDLPGIRPGINELDFAATEEEKFGVIWFANPHSTWWQQFSNNGTKIGDKIYLGSELPDDTSDVATTKTEPHKSLVTWHNFGNDICTQTIYQNGSLSSADCDPCPPTSQTRIHIVSTIRLSEDRFLVGMLLSNNAWAGREIDGKLYNSDAQPFGQRFQVYLPSEDFIHSFSTASLSTGDFVVVWSTAYRIDGQMLRPDGSKEGAVFQIFDGSTEIQNPKVVGLTQGKFVVIWQSIAEKVSDLYGQLFDVTRTKNGDLFKINSMPKEDAQTPSAVKLEDDNFVVIWGGDSNIYGQVINASPSSPISETSSSLLFVAIGCGVGGIVMIGGIAYLLKKKCVKSEERSALLNQSAKTPINRSKEAS